jgi:WD40 repeat protein
LEFSPDGKFVASGGDKNVGVWHSSTGKPYSVFKEHTAEVQSLVFSNDGSRLYASGYRELIVLDLATKDESRCFRSKART